MVNVMWLSLAALLTWHSLVWFAVAMPHHWQQLYPQTAPRSAMLRGLGGGALGAAMLCCLMADHLSMAVLVQIMLATCSAVGIAMLLGYNPHALRYCCPRLFSQSSSA